MSRKWRCAVIGTGMVGEWHVRTIPKTPGCSLVAICDHNEANGRKALEKNSLNVPIYADAVEMFKKEKLDAVHVCTPSGDHQGPAVLAMKRGLCVVVEKPMEIQPDRIDAMAETAKKNKVHLAGIFQNRWHPANQAIKKAMEENRFGKLAWAGSFTPWYRPDKYYEDVAWRGTWKLDGGGAVMNQGVHQVDLIQWIMGPVKTVCAFASSRIHAKIETEDTMTCALEFASGAYGTFMSTTAMHPGGSTRLEIGGEDGTAVSEGGLKRFAFRNEKPEDKELLEKLDPARSQTTGGGKSASDVPLDLHALNIASIYDAWSRDEDAVTAAPEARKAVAIIQAMYKSARAKGAPTDVT